MTHRLLLMLAAALLSLGAECDFSGIVDALCRSGSDHASCPRPKFVFVTSTTHRGDLVGGIAGGDAICNARAASSPLAGRSFIAWLSTPGADVRDRLTEPGGRGFVRTDGEVVARTIADLLDGSIDIGISLTETGGDVGATLAWTGTNSDGTAGDSHCSSWAGSGSGNRGQTNLTSISWTNGGSNSCTGFSLRLYCFEI